MYEQDYIMRLIHEMVRLFIKLIFGIDEEKSEEIIINESNSGEKYDPLLELLRQGKINEAENLLYEELDPNNKEDLKIALLFYERLSRLSPTELEMSDYTSEEIKEGIQRVLTMYGYGDMGEIYLK